MAAERQRSIVQPLRDNGCTRFFMRDRQCLHVFSSNSLCAGAAELSERANHLDVAGNGLATLGHWLQTAVVGYRRMDSHGIIVMVHAFDLLGLPRAGMWLLQCCFGTTDRTYQTLGLAELWGNLREIRLQECFDAFCDLVKTNRYDVI